MAISRFQSRFKSRTDLMDNITPNNVVQMNASVPHGEWKPANWLPVVWQNEKSKDFFTISSGKIVSLDASGRVVPSGILRKCLDATAETDVILTYTQNDVDARVINITTGEFVTSSDIVGAAAQITLREFVEAVIANGWLAQDTDITDVDGPTQLGLVKDAAKAFISAPVGIAAYDIYVWAGDDPANLHFTNYQKQHLVQFFTDIQMKVAHICEVSGNIAVPALGSFTTGVSLGNMPRYQGLDMSDVIGLDLGLGKVATSTSRTPLTLAGDWRERSDVSLLARAGDWYLDADAGILLFWEEGGDQIPNDASGNALAGNITVFDYASTSSQDRMTMFAGECRPGDFVSFDAFSNFTVASASDLSAHYVVGRLLALYKEPRGLLERVRTGFESDDFDATAKMPGSATRGFSDLITLSDYYGKDLGDRVADEIAVINVKIQ